MDDFSATPNTTGHLTPGGKATGNLEAAFDGDWFKITLQAGVSYRFMLGGAADGMGTLDATGHADSLNMVVYDAQWRRVDKDTHYTTASGFLPAAVYTPASSGDYYIALQSFGTLTGTYTLNASVITGDDHGDIAATATPLTMNAPVAGAIGPTGDVDMFSAALTAGTLYQLVSTPVAGAARFDPAWTWSVPSLSATGDALTLSGAPETTGTYFAAVTAAGTAGYTVVLQTLADDYTNTIATTGRLVDGTFSGRIDAPNDVDWFAVQLTAGHAYRFSASGNSVALSLRLPAIDGRIIDFALAADGSFLSNYSGTYYLQVGSGQTGDYIVDMQPVADDIGDDAAHALPMPSNGVLMGTMNFVGDHDAVTLHASKGHAYLLTYTLAANGDDGVLEFDAAWNQNVILPGGGGMQSMQGARSLLFYARDDVDWTATLSQGHYQGAGAYTLRYQDLGADDFGDTADQATRVAPTSVTAGRIDTWFDVDAMRVSLAWGVNYVISLGGDLANQAPAFNRGLTVDTSPHGSFSPNQLSVTAHAGEDIIFYVRDDTQRIGAYTVSFIPVADDFYANPSTSGRLAAGGSASGTFETTTDRDWYAIDLKAGTTYVFQSTAPARWLGIMDASGHVLSDLPVTNRDSIALSFAPAKDGTYYLEAGTGRGTTDGAGTGPGAYTVSASAGPTDDHPVPVLVPIGTTASGTIDFPGDTDSFLFDLKAGHLYTFDGTLRFVGSVTDSTLQVLLVSRLDGDNVADSVLLGPYSRVVVPATDGRYRVSFSTASTRDITGYKIGAVDHGLDDYPATPGTTLTPGSALRGTIEAATDVDAFTVAASGQALTLVLHGEARNGYDALATTDTLLSVSNANGGFAAYAVRGSDVFLKLPYATGPLTVSVSSLKGNGTYTLELVDTSKDFTTPVLLNSQGETIGLNDPMHLRFSEHVGLVVYSTSSSYDNGSYFSITDASGRTVANYAADDAAHVHWQGNDLVITPDLPWQPGQTYTLSNTRDFEDLAGHTMSVRSQRFVTAPLATAPGAGSGVYGGTHTGATIDGGAGIDSVYYAGTSASQTIRAQANGNFTVAAANSKTDSLVGIERVLFGGQKDAIALDVGATGSGGQAYRLYQAAFDRAPDNEGIGFWISAMDHGTSLRDVAGAFIASAEFQQRYGITTSDTDFVNLLYDNVLHRDADSAGFANWFDQLQHGVARTDVLIGFSESPENQAAIAQIIGNGFAYTPYTS